MKIITEPSVYLVGKSAVNDAELDRFLDDHDIASWQTDTEVGGEKLVEVAGRLCYMSFSRPRPGGNKGYTNHILEVGHGSVLEHSVYNLIIDGVSRSLTHELVRHRAGMGYSQLSQRFVDESDCAFVVPPALAHAVQAAQQYMQAYHCADPSDALAWMMEWHPQVIDSSGDSYVGLRWLDSITRAQRDYAGLAELIQKDMDDSAGIALPNGGSTTTTARRKAAREAARSVLPNATETKIFVTGNARALRHFIEMRGDAAADAEIRRLAVAVLKLLQADSPNLFGDYQLNCVNGQESTTTPYTKV